MRPFTKKLSLRGGVRQGRAAAPPPDTIKKFAFSGTLFMHDVVMVCKFWPSRKVEIDPYNPHATMGVSLAKFGVESKSGKIFHLRRHLRLVNGLVSKWRHI